MGVFKAFDGMHQIELHIKWQTGRDSIWVEFVCGQPLGLQEDLVTALVRKAVYLVLDAGAITRPDTLIS